MYHCFGKVVSRYIGRNIHSYQKNVSTRTVVVGGPKSTLSSEYEIDIFAINNVSIHNIHGFPKWANQIIQ